MTYKVIQWSTGNVGRHAVLRDLLARLQLATEGRYLDHFRSELHVGEAETPSDDPAISEQLLDLIRMRRRPDVKVLWAAPEQQIPNAAADEIRHVVELAEAVQDLKRVRIDVAAR